MTLPTPLVSTDWLAANLKDPNLVILDTSMKKATATAESSDPDLQIPGTRFFDIKVTFSDATSDLPNTMPSPEAFTQACQDLGINRNSKIVVYDRLGIYSSPRAWWMFRTMGHEAVAVLDGRLPAWMQQQYPVEPVQPISAGAGDFEAEYQPERIRNAADIQENLNTARAIVLDARSHGRFTGAEPEPRAGLKGGHIPQSINLPYTRVLRDEKFLPRNELATLIEGLDLDNRPLIFSCGSGITACIILLACERVLDNPVSVYDGSWSEWGQPECDFPVA